MHANAEALTSLALLSADSSRPPEASVSTGLGGQEGFLWKHLEVTSNLLPQMRLNVSPPSPVIASRTLVAFQKMSVSGKMPQFILPVCQVNPSFTGRGTWLQDH